MYIVFNQARKQIFFRLFFYIYVEKESKQTLRKIKRMRMRERERENLIRKDNTEHYTCNKTKLKVNTESIKRIYVINNVLKTP